MSQTEKLRTILLDGRVHRVPELLRRVYGINSPSSARLAARIYDLRKRGYEIYSDEVSKGSTTWWYRMEVEKSVVFKVEKARTKKSKIAA